jgi:hypothetical protein
MRAVLKDCMNLNKGRECVFLLCGELEKAFLVNSYLIISRKLLLSVSQKITQKEAKIGEWEVKK